MIDYGALDPKNTPDASKYLLPGETTAKLASGNAVDELNGIGVGLGTEQTQGSGEIYKTNGQTTPSWIGQQYSGQLEKDETAIQNATAGGAYSPTPITHTTGTSSNGILQNAPITTSTGSGSGGLMSGAEVSQQMTPAQLQAQTTAAQNDMTSIFNATGGAAGWGVSQAEWLNSMSALLGSISPGTQWART